MLLHSDSPYHMMTASKSLVLLKGKMIPPYPKIRCKTELLSVSVAEHDFGFSDVFLAMVRLPEGNI